MKALVTGAAGFAGRYLVSLLLEKGYEVCATYHRAPLIGEGSRRLVQEQMDVTDRPALYRLCRNFKPDEVYHLAGIAVTTGRDAGLYYRVNFLGTVNLFDALREEAQSAKILYVSSGNIYGAVENCGQPIREEHGLNPPGHYAASKAAADVICSAYVTEGMHIIRARPFNHTGPGQSTAYVCSRLAERVAAAVLGQAPPVVETGNLDAARDFTDVRDVVEAYWLLLQKGRSGEAYNVCSQRAYSIREIAGLLAEHSGADVTFRSRPDLVRRTDIPVLLGCRDKIGRDTGWKPKIPLRTTLQDLLLYWLEKLREGK